MAVRTARFGRPFRSVRFITKALTDLGIRYRRAPLRARLTPSRKQSQSHLQDRQEMACHNLIQPL
jgi:hypothetical protein